MKTTTLKIKLTFKQPTLGSRPGNKEAMEEFIAAKAPNQSKTDEEMSAADVAKEVDKKSTVFPVDETGLFAWDYQWRGAFKGWLRNLIDLGEAPPSLNIYNIAKAVDNFLFVNPRRVYYYRPVDGKVFDKPTGDNQRPLRAQTMQGERIALSRSEELCEGTWMEFEIEFLSPDKAAKTNKLAVFDVETIKKCLDYGKYVGFSQWRGGGWGRFEYEIEQKA